MGAVQAPLANLWAFWWSFSSTSPASVSPTRAAAASTPAWRIPPPRAFRRRQASSVKSLGPPTRAPTGAPRPWGKRGESCLPAHGCASLSSGLWRGQKGQGWATLWPHQGRGLEGPSVSGCQHRSSGTQLGLLRWAPLPARVGGGPAASLPWRNRETQNRSAPRCGRGARTEPPRRSSAGPHPGEPGPHSSGPAGAPGGERQEGSEGQAGGRGGGRMGLQKITGGSLGLCP